jgi:hypothetical protein
LKAAEENHRHWIGIDESDLAIQAAKEKLAAMQDSLFAVKPEYELVMKLLDMKDKKRQYT